MFFKILRLFALILWDVTSKASPVTPLVFSETRNQLFGNFNLEHCLETVKVIIITLCQSHLACGDVERAQALRSGLDFITEEVPSREVKTSGTEQNARKTASRLSAAECRTSNLQLARQTSGSSDFSLSASNQGNESKQRKKVLNGNEAVAIAQQQNNHSTVEEITTTLASYLVRLDHVGRAIEMIKKPHSYQHKGIVIEVDEEKTRIPLRRVYGYEFLEASVTPASHKNLPRSGHHAPMERILTFEGSGAECIDNTLRELGVQTNRTISTGRFGLDLMKYVEQSGTAPKPERLREFLGWATVERLKRETNGSREFEHKAFLCKDESLRTNKRFCDSRLTVDRFVNIAREGGIQGTAFFNSRPCSPQTTMMHACLLGSRW